MKLIKKYTAIRVYNKKNENDEYIPKFSYGDIKGPYYSLDYPETEFDTEEEAIQYAYTEDKYANWMIVPIVKFDYF